MATAAVRKNRFQNALTVSNIALSSVLTDTFGKSATVIVDYILTCDVFDPEHCKSLLLKKAKDKADDVVKSIIGYELRGDQPLKMKVCRKHFDYINECVDTLEEAVSDLSKPYHKFIELATTIPGITEKFASFIIAEIGVDMAVFKSSKRLCSWAGLTPQNNESAGKKKSVHISRAGVYLKPCWFNVQTQQSRIKRILTSNTNMTVSKNAVDTNGRSSPLHA